METLKLLIVDDEEGMRNGMNRSLANYKMRFADIDEDIGLQIELAENGNEALSKFASFSPDIMLLDYKLPDMTGLEILEQITDEKNETLTIMVTAYASLETAVSAIKSGAFDFLSKPFTPAEIRTKVSKAAQSRILARQVKKLNEEKRQVRFQFISVLGHELKAPLGAVEGYLYMLNDRAMGNELDKYDDCVKRCLVRTEQMRKLIIDLLELTKIESGNRNRLLKKLDINELIRTSIETFTPDALKRNIDINFQPASNCYIMADSTEMEIVFNNLISNAVKYNKDNGKVDVKVIAEQNSLFAEVSDTGIGMTKEECSKLFKEFVRIKNNQTKNILGTGLGLSTIKKIAQLYSGDITVESEQGKGTTFKVELALQEITDEMTEIDENEKIIIQKNISDSKIN